MSPRPSQPNRRGVLAGLAGLSASPALAGAARPCAVSDPFAHLDATAQADLVSRGEVTASELVEAAIKRAETLNPALNAIVTPMYPAARAAASGRLPDGPFRGVPFLVKDLNDLAGVRRTSGSRLLLDNIASTTDPIIARSLDAGFVVLGKSNTPEFALSATTEPLALGAAHNPWALDRSPGGSSGGAAAAVAAGLVPIAHASDGGGSIRIPTSCCGLFGLKPSRGRMIGSRSATSEFAVEHCVARSVRDSARLFAWNERQDAGAPLPPVGWVRSPGGRRLRIAFATRDIFGNEPAPAVKATVDRAGRLCEALGHRVEPVGLPGDGEPFIDQFMVAWSSSGDRAWKLAQQMGQAPEEVLEPWTLYLAAQFRRQPADALPKALAYFSDLGARWAALYEQYDLVLTPVVHAEPPRLGFLRGDTPGPVLWDRMTHYAAYTPLHNAIGAPAMSVPLWTGPLPIGCQFAAAWGRERTLFELAYELEATSVWRLSEVR